MKNLIKKLLRETFEIDEMDYQSFKGLKELQDALSAGIIISVAYVKKDRTVRHMAAKKFVSAYQASTTPKSEKQLNMKANNNIQPVIDVNIYNKAVKQTDNKPEAAKLAWRMINLGSVLGFMVKGKFIDLREENNIMQTYGPEIYNSLSKTMLKTLEIPYENR